MFRHFARHEFHGHSQHYEHERLRRAVRLFATALTYLGRAGRRRLVDMPARMGAQRDLTVVVNEASPYGAELFLDHRPAEAGPPDVRAVGLLTLVAWRGGRPTVEVLARTGPHGQWLEWTLQEYDYAPRARSTPGA